MTQHYVYVIQSYGGFYSKIGVSSNPLGRLSSIQTGCPLKLSLAAAYTAPSRAAAYRAEKAAHEALAEYHEKGEWFSIPYDTCAEPIELALYGRTL